MKREKVMVIVKARHCPKVPFLMGKKRAESALQFSEGKKREGRNSVEKSREKRMVEVPFLTGG